MKNIVEHRQENWLSKRLIETNSNEMPSVEFDWENVSENGATDCNNEVLKKYMYRTKRNADVNGWLARNSRCRTKIRFSNDF